MNALPPIPTPLALRWREFRIRILPVVCFAAALGCAGYIWRQELAVPALVGQVEPVQADVRCYKSGMLAELTVTRFQNVKAGDPVGQVLVTDPKVLASSLAVIQADIEMLRVGMQPIAARQRTAMDYSQLRLDWMRQRAQLATVRVNLQLAGTEFRRTEELFKDKIVSERVYEQAKAAQERLQKEVDELSQLVDEQARNFEQLQITNGVEISKVSDAPLRAAIAAQESKLRLTEAELSPIILKAPVDGTVSMIYHRSGEAVSAGEPIVAVAAFNAVRIVGYLRPPIISEPKVGTRVVVRARGWRRETGSAQIMEVGTQFETIAPALQSPMKLANIELGLPIGVSIPRNLKIRPGELVDLTLVP